MKIYLWCQVPDKYLITHFGSYYNTRNLEQLGPNFCSMKIYLRQNRLPNCVRFSISRSRLIEYKADQKVFIFIVKDFQSKRSFPVMWIIVIVCHLVSTRIITDHTCKLQMYITNLCSQTYSTVTQNITHYRVLKSYTLYPWAIKPMGYCRSLRHLSPCHCVHSDHSTVTNN